MTHYEVLGVVPSATAAELRRAYLDLARRHHPDRSDATGVDDDRMREVNAAWAVLGDPERRLAYDRELAGGREPGTRTGRHGGGADGTSSFVRSHVHHSNAENATSPGWRPFDDESEEDDPVELLDDTPVPGTEVPRWMQVVPPYLLALAVLSFVIGLVASLDEVVVLGAVALALSLLSFVAVPLFAVFTSRSHDLDP